jgi:uncharacterized membrane protein
MALEDDLQQPGDSARGEGGPQLSALGERVARLERELDVLRRQIAIAPPALSQAPADVRTAPPPPPIPPHSETVAPAAPPLTSAAQIPAAAQLRSTEAWAYPPPIPSQPAKPRESFENRLGSQIFNRIGIVLLLIGTAWFLKLAVDRQWIVPSPTGRVIAGLIAGAGIVLWSERFRKKGFAAFSYSLKALGSGVLYLSLWAAFQLYHLLPAPAALGLMVLVTMWNAWMAWAQNSELLAAYALAGGFATPMLLSSGGNHETFLFTYLLAIDIATVALVRLRHWPRLLFGAFPLTVAFFIGWYIEFFAMGELNLTSVFIVLFGGTFMSVSVGRDAGASVADPNIAPRTNRSTLIEDILLPLANAAFVSLAFYSVLQDSGDHALLPWLMIVLAAIYLGFMRLPQSRTASAIHLSLAVVLLTIAVPLKASGHWITVSWLVEGLALLWVATRIAPAAPSLDPSDAYASRTLRWLASAALLLGFCGIFAHSIWSGWTSPVSFFNADMATSLIGVAVFAAAAWLALRAGSDAVAGTSNWPGIAISAFIAIDLVAALLTLRELLLSWSAYAPHAPFQSADFATALVGLAVFAGVVAVSLRLALAHPDASFWKNCAALSTIAFNLVAVLTGVREIDAIWDLSATSSSANLDAALQQALAISGFLMLYGAVLLAVGFWKRSAFLRWQALLLLVFTIFKTFLYDMRDLSQGYRVVSFLGLGALLMAISFAYQKDWLNLREQPDEPSADTSEAAR